MTNWKNKFAIIKALDDLKFSVHICEEWINGEISNNDVVYHQLSQMFQDIPAFVLDDIEFIELMLETLGIVLYFLPDRIKSDKNYVLKAVGSKRHRTSIVFASDKLKADKDILKKCLKNFKHTNQNRFPKDYEVIPKVHFENEQFLWELISGSGSLFPYLPDRLKSDLRFIEAAAITYEDDDFFSHVKASFSAYEPILPIITAKCSLFIDPWFSDCFSSRDFTLKVIACMNVISNSYKELNQRIFYPYKNDQIIVEQLIKANFQLGLLDEVRRILENISDTLRNDRFFFGEIVRLDGLYIQYAADQLKRDRTLALLAATNNGMALKFFAPELIDDKEIVTACIAQSGDSFTYASNRLKEDFELILIACDNGASCSFLKGSLKTKENYIKFYKGGILWQWPDEILADREVITNAIKIYGPSILYAPFEFRNDIELVKIAIENYSDVIDFLNDKRMKGFGYENNLELMRSLMKKRGKEYLKLPANLKEDKFIVINAFTQNHEVFPYLSDTFKNDPEIAIIAVGRDSSMIFEINPIINNKEILLTYMQNTLERKGLIKLIPKSLKQDIDIIRCFFR
jgi:hypothetical protein